MPQGFMWDAAPQFNALIIFAEHRYYGKSLPFGKASLKPKPRPQRLPELRTSLGRLRRPFDLFKGQHDWIAKFTGHCFRRILRRNACRLVPDQVPSHLRRCHCRLRPRRSICGTLRCLLKNRNIRLQICRRTMSCGYSKILGCDRQGVQGKGWGRLDFQTVQAL